MRRTIRVFGVAAVAALAVGVFGAGAAQAGHTGEVNGGLLKAGATESCKATADGTLTAHGVSSTGITIHATTTTIATEECKVTQVGEGAAAELVGSIKKVTYGGITIDSPVGCKTTETISTNPITSHIVTIEHPKGSGKKVAFTTINPTASTNGTFANITLKECPAAETYPLKGQLCTEMAQAGVLAVEQTVKFSATADEACSTDKMTLAGGAVAVTVRGGVIFEMSGPGAGKPWGFTAT